jgi:hypothetical protein
MGMFVCVVMTSEEQGYGGETSVWLLDSGANVHAPTQRKCCKTLGRATKQFWLAATMT